jgi:hypothetical protein
MTCSTSRFRVATGSSACSGQCGKVSRRFSKSRLTELLTYPRHRLCAECALLSRRVAHRDRLRCTFVHSSSPQVTEHALTLGVFVN